MSSRGENSFLKELTPIEEGGKMKMTGRLPKKVYPMTLKYTGLISVWSDCACHDPDCACKWVAHA